MRTCLVLTLSLLIVGGTTLAGEPAREAPKVVLKSADGKLVLICHYDQHGNWLYCDVASPR